MGLLQKACETYDCFAHLAGVEEVGKTPLAPVSHILTSAQLEITLNEKGGFVAARAVNKEEPKIIIPVTEASGGRTSAPCAHPLCEQLSYLAGYDEKKHTLYVEQLTAWSASDYSHPKLRPILTYVENGMILGDLLKASLVELDGTGIPKNEKALVRWVVNGLGLEQSGPCWTASSLFQSFIAYYAHCQQASGQTLCMISGETATAASQHPKGIIPINGNAKLISANDTSGFTYRGRFAEDWQAASVSYTASQKAHNALRWIAANQGVRMALPGDETIHWAEQDKVYTAYGGRTFLCWNPHGLPLPPLTGALASRRRQVQKPIAAPSAYQKQLRETLSGWKTDLPAGADVVIAAFDAATTGRLALTYFNELQASDFLDRLYRWDLTCAWENGTFGIQCPSLFQIVNCAYGTYREQGAQDGKFVTEDRILRQQMQRLVSCRVDGTKFPWDMERRIVEKASRLMLYGPRSREKLLFTACAVIAKCHSDHKQNEEA